MKFFTQLKYAVLHVFSAAPPANLKNTEGVIIYDSRGAAGTEHAAVSDGLEFRRLVQTDGFGTSGQILTSNANNLPTWQDAPAGGGSVQIEVAQAAHGFAVGEAIYHNGTSWVYAQADNENTLAEFVVSEVVDAGNFIAAKFGNVTSTAHGLTVGEHYFLSDTVPGGATPTEPAEFSAPLFYVLDANTLILEVYRPSTSGTPATLLYNYVIGTGFEDDVNAANTAASAGQSLFLLAESTPSVAAPQLITKSLGVTGTGFTSVINGDLTISADGTHLTNVFVEGTITINANNVCIIGVGVSIGNTVVDNGVNNLILVLEEA